MSFDKWKTPGIKGKTSEERGTRVPEGMWFKCTNCGEVMETRVLRENHFICVECNQHFRMSARERIQHLTSGAPFKEYGDDLVSTDPLEFTDRKPYKDRLDSSIAKTGRKDAFVSGRTTIQGIPVQLGVFEFKFMGGSMGTVVGERVAMLFENALKDETPAVIVSASGGARMQESILSLMQMAKTSALVLEMQKAKLPYISVLTDPTTGGVAASFAMLGDIILAEPKALIGFAGPRVIEQTIRQRLPEGFQKAEFLLQKGFIDQVVPRAELPATIASILSMLLWKRNRKPTPVERAKPKKKTTKKA